MRLGNGYEECRIVICPAFEVLFQMNFCAGVEIDFPFFVAFTENDALAFVKVYIFSINFTSSPTRIPVDDSMSMIARSRIWVQLSRKISRFSSDSTSLIKEPVLTLWMRLTGLLRI